MKIYVITHGLYEYEHISLCTISFDLAIKHFLDYYKQNPDWNIMGSIQVWEENKCIFEYGDRNYHIINSKWDKNNITYEMIEKDMLKYAEKDMLKDAND